MNQDYLKQKQYLDAHSRKRSKVRSPRYNNVPISRTKNQKYNAQNLLQQKQRQNRKNRQQLTNLQKTAFIVGASAKLLYKISQTKIGLISMAAIALLSTINYLKSKNNEENWKDNFGFTPPSMSGKSTGKLSEKGKKFIMQEEGVRLKAYKDTKGIWTIGVGHTGQVDGKPIHQGMTITQEKAKQLFEQDIVKFEKKVNKAVKVPVTQNMFDAMVSYAFNVGSLGPKFLSKLNSGDYEGAVKELSTINAELQNRRKREQALFSADLQSNTLTQVPINAETKITSAGVMTNYNNGVKIGNYQMYNPAAQRKYITLSERAEAYIRDTGGSGYITSGAEGSHGKGNVSHGTGNKIDVAAYKNTDEGWADTAIPFIKNPNTAYINFEDFTPERFNRIKQIIYSKISDELIKKCESKVKYSFSRDKKFLFRFHTGHGLHLDIAILPNSYVGNDLTQTQNKVKQIPSKKQTPAINKPTNTEKPATIIQKQSPKNNKTITNGINTGHINTVTAKKFGRNIARKNTKI